MRIQDYPGGSVNADTELWWPAAEELKERMAAPLETKSKQDNKSTVGIAFSSSTSIESRIVSLAEDVEYGPKDAPKTIKAFKSEQIMTTTSHTAPQNK